MSVSSTLSYRAEAKIRTLHVVVLAGAPEDCPGLANLVAQGSVVAKQAAAWTDAITDSLVEDADAVVVIPPEDVGEAEIEARLHQLAITLVSHRLGALVMDHRSFVDQWDGTDLVVRVPKSIGAAELWGRLVTMAHYRCVLAQMERQLRSMQRLGKRLNRHFAEVDQEMQLATRLQRDFLPRELPQVGQVRFSAVFRPATWVSGDIYDIYRADEQHVAFYVADAVGHGVAAGLLTMLIKQAIRSKVTGPESYEMLTPSQTMIRLNDALVEQNLQNSQFVTACYCLLNTETLELSYSRGGHPYPLHIAADGTIRELKVEGGLLGIFENDDFPFVTVRLQPGDKVVLFSDGIEPMLVTGRGREDGLPEFGQALLDAAALSAEGFVSHITQAIDEQEGSLSPDDDVTIVVLEIIPA